jgi:hypothetical protein
MANRLWWAACVLVGAIVLVEVAAVGLWLLNHYPASQASSTTIQRVKQPQPLSNESSEIGPLSSELAQLLASHEANQQEAKNEDPNGRIAFVATTRQRSISTRELFTMNANGTERTRLTSLGMETMSPSMKADILRLSTTFG